MHMFPQLRKIEEKFANELVIIGVHSPKFPSERETENLRQAILRHDLKHPVINDRDYQVWSAYACRAWPTIMFLTPDGKVIGKHEGEASFEALDRLLAQMVEEFDEQGLIDRHPLELRRESEAAGALSFPGKVLADEGSGKLYIADSSHNRIIRATLDGQVEQVYGDGTAGFEDGGPGQARFDHPQGMALLNGSLYVADTENHAIRRIDLDSGETSTAAGTGEQGGRGALQGTALETALSSPWDLEAHDTTVFIAMAGSHQLWALELATGQVRVHAGNGREAPIDGPLLTASLDQPSGLATDGTLLYFADSEASAIRTASVDPEGRVNTIVGQDLFVFGDVDGVGLAVRLQHPLGLCYHEGTRYVADSYNHKVTRVLPLTKSSLTFASSGQPGHCDGLAAEAQFQEPSGLSVANGALYVADTNNHVIRTVELATGKVATLEITGL